MFNEIKVAAVSFRPKRYDLEGNAGRLEGAFREAAASGAQLAVGPEGVLEGFVVHDITLGKRPPSDMVDVALTTRSRWIRHFRALARELKMCLVFGFVEKKGRELFNCAVFLDHHGEICGKQHKMQFGCGYDPAWWYNRLGRHSRAFDTPFNRCGILICNDRWNPELARIPVLDGARYLVIPSFGSRTVKQDKTVLQRARENGVPIVEANVGVTLIVSKGEIVARSSRRVNAVTTGTIAIPAPSSPALRDQQERDFLAWREREMPSRLRRWHKKKGVD